MYIYTRDYVLLVEIFIFGFPGFDFSVDHIIVIFGCIGVCPYMVTFVL